MRCLRTFPRCLHFAARESADYLYGTSVEKHKLLATFAIVLLVPMSTLIHFRHFSSFKSIFNFVCAVLIPINQVHLNIINDDPSQGQTSYSLKTAICLTPC